MDVGNHPGCGLAPLQLPLPQRLALSLSGPVLAWHAPSPGLGELDEVVPALERVRQGNQKFKARLNYMRP